MAKEFGNDSRNLSYNIHALIGTHSKSVNNYAKERSTRQFRLPSDPAAGERTAAGEKEPSFFFFRGWMRRRKGAGMKLARD